MKKSSVVSLIGLSVLAGIATVSSVVSIVESSTPADNPQQLPVVTAAENASASQIGAVGLVEPASQFIKIGSNLSGIVSEVFVVAGSTVRKGDPLFALDTRAASALLAQRRQELAVAAARLHEQRARVPELLASVQEAQSNLNAAQAEQNDAADLLRVASHLTAGTGIAKRELVRRKMLLQSKRARVGEARAKLAKTKIQLSLIDEQSNGASIAVESSLLEKARAVVEIAETNLQLAVVQAPIDGVVLQVNIRAGEFAQAGALAESLMVVGDTTSLHVRVDIDEADISRFHKRKTAFASVRSSRDEKIPLTFLRIEPLVVPKRSLTGRAEERVDTRVLQVIYELESNDPSIFPGQLLGVSVTSQDAETTAASTEVTTVD